MDFPGAIIFCNICCSNVDAPPEAGWQEFTCEQCGTEFKVNIDPEIIAAHSSV